MSAAASFPTVYASEQELAATDRQRERYNEHNISEEIKGTQQLATNTIFATSGFGKTQGIRAIAKDLQPRWQDVLSRPSYPKNGAPITIYDQTTGQLSLQSTQAQPSKQSNHALGPQHIVNSSQLSSLPDAPHRQSWSNQPTYRWFKRSNYDDVPDRWCSHQESLHNSRGDNYYRPLSIAEQTEINARVARRTHQKGAPRLGEW